MTEATLADFNSAQLQALTPEGRATAEAAFARAGFSKEAIAAKLSPAPAPKPAADPGRNVPLAPVNDGLSPDVLAQHYQKLAKHWSGDPEALKAAAKRDGIDLDAITAQKQVTADSIAAEREASILAQLSPPRTPAEYQIKLPPDLIARTDIREVVKLEGEIRGALHAGGVPQSLANGLIQVLFATANAYEGMKPEANALRYAEEGARFSKLPGDTAENVRLATLAYNALPESFRAKMDAMKAFHSAASQAALLQVGRALAEKDRRSGAKK